MAINLFPPKQTPAANLATNYYRTYDNTSAQDFDDHDRFLDVNVTGNQVLNQLIKGDPQRAIINLVNTAKSKGITSELTDIINSNSNTRTLDQVLGRYANMDNYKFIYGINDSKIEDNVKLYEGFVDKIEDPTILTFTTEIDVNNSPLFQTQGDLINFISLRQNDFPASEVSLEGQNFPNANNIGGLYNLSLTALLEFQRTILQFFTPYSSSVNGNFSKSYYITSVTGLNNIDNAWGGKDGINTSVDSSFDYNKLTFKLRDDVKLSARNLYFMYNTLKMHRRSGKVLIPENLLRFNMWIKISEIRNFTSLRFAVENGSNSDIIDAIKYDVSALYYYVQDCYFDFNKLHTVENYSTETENTYETLEFDVMYRRAFRVFNPTLLKSEKSGGNFIYTIDERTASAFSNDKSYTFEQINNFKILKTFGTSQPSGSLRPSLMPNLNTFDRSADPINAKTPTSNSTKTNNTKTPTGGSRILQSLSSFATTALKSAANTLVNTIANAAKMTVLQKRNQLVRDLQNKVKNEVGFGVPRPDNIYEPNKGSGIIGTTLQNLSQATGINFLAIRNGQSIQPFSATDTNVLNPALEGRPILMGPGGDYSKLNPNIAKGGSIDNVEPASNFVRDTSLLNIDLQPSPGIVADTTILNVDLQPNANFTPNIAQLNVDLQPAVNFVPDTTVLNVDLQPSVTTKPDTTILNVDLQPNANFTPDTKILNVDLQPAANFVPDTTVLNVDLQPASNLVIDTNVLNVDLQPAANFTPDTSVLNVDLQPNANFIMDVKSLNVDLQPNSNFTPDVTVLNVDLQPTATVTPNLDALNTDLQPASNVKPDLTKLGKIEETIPAPNTLNDPNVNGDNRTLVNGLLINNVNLEPTPNTQTNTDLLKPIDQTPNKDQQKNTLGNVNGN